MISSCNHGLECEILTNYYGAVAKNARWEREIEVLIEKGLSVPTETVEEAEKSRENLHTATMLLRNHRENNPRLLN